MFLFRSRVGLIRKFKSFPTLKRFHNFNANATPIFTPNLSQTPHNIELREYQLDCIESCLQALEENKRRIGAVLPTGSGKTVVFAHLLNQVKPRKGYGDKTLILAHRKELILQAAKTCRSINPDKKVGIIMSDESSATDDDDIIVASVSSLQNDQRLRALNPKDFKLIIVDEAHHAVTNSYLRVFNHFDVKDSNSDVAVLDFQPLYKEMMIKI
ncbi:putative ATP-dependent RNA helicase [Wickerhamomyces ciferrii]|uniref:ATP-dependent RNA helicase n=1 Tax=Wickerhamomyces ciferrii (strain ATCC 14091 / BCRC 22168 / CBS 111 / JCM 3599 / NBRC 0793 / NRRL Y-1031 F-60-10) TaxID=1206466 RepID=K0KL08_WICCF|nr:putative ATP-dependent RNA helicase [Wickerhamomyces ciferrii]CCH42847.1 putative ATP-dependent RNA helicase [Wickerhamomyces ciferrii]